MTVLNRLERALCSLYVAITYPIVSLGNAWMERIERMERPERARPRDTMIASPDGTVQPSSTCSISTSGSPPSPTFNREDQ